MAKKIKKAIKKQKKKIVLWAWLIILIPLIVAIMWLISLILFYNKIPLVYGEKASPRGIGTLIGLILIFIISYGVFALMGFRKTTQSL